MRSIWLAIVKKAITWLIEHADFKLFTSPHPMGYRLGGADDPNLPDLYLIIGIWYNDAPLLVGYFQKS